MTTIQPEVFEPPYTIEDFDRDRGGRVITDEHARVMATEFLKTGRHVTVTAYLLTRWTLRRIGADPNCPVCKADHHTLCADCGDGKNPTHCACLGGQVVTP
jgi:hypothetical protein